MVVEAVEAKVIAVPSSILEDKARGSRHIPITPETYPEINQQGLDCIRLTELLTQQELDLAAQREGFRLSPDYNHGNDPFEDPTRVIAAIDTILRYIREKVAPPLGVDGPVETLIENTHQDIDKISGIVPLSNH